MEILGGPLYGVAGAGESHGPAITTIVFGCPPGLKLERARLQSFLDRRRPGANKHGTPRHEADQLMLLSGLYTEDHDRLLAGPAITVATTGGALETRTYEEGHTTGEPIAAVVLSAAKRSADYLQFAGPQGAVRPGHADLVKYYKSGGFTDPRGGGRSSYRSTISDVIGGSVARLFLHEHFGTAIFSSIYQVGPLQTQVRLADRLAALQTSEGRIAPEALRQLAAQLEAAEIHSLDPDFARAAGELIKTTRQQDDSLGAGIEVVAVQVPALVGEPLYQSLKLRLMGSLGGLHAVQSCEMGSGREAVERRGSEHNDPIRRQGYQGNHHGGLLGGITTGMPLVFRVGFKPTSTIALPQQSVRKDLEEIDFQLQKGRHDPCVGVRAGITLESRLAIELMNAVLMHQAGRVDPQNFNLF
ncbi:MAG: chorismate synthase [Candidatus Latescibacteria bacterium]|nr:chorismate synthase [Candidatus Latescibacterota bacterium]